MRALNDCIKEDKSKADRMFKELGYKKIFENEVNCNYESSVDKYFNSTTIIHFDKEEKSIKIWNNAIDMQELQAINEKVKELGWIKEKKNI